MSSLLTVLIVDDHFVVRSGLTASLEIEEDIRVVAECKRGEDAVALYQRHRPTVILMDMQLPGINGVEATAAVRTYDPSARVLMFSTFAHDDEIQGAIDVGASGYIQKSASRDELLAALRQIASGASYLPADIAQRLSHLRLKAAITPREREILVLIAQGRANKEIAAVLAVSEDTVKRHVSHILDKLEANDRAQATAEAIRRGIVKVSG